MLTLGARVMYGLWMSDMNGSKESTAAVEQRIRKNAVRAAAAVTAVSAPPPAVPLAPTVTGTLPPGPVTRRKSLSNSNAWEGGGAMEATSSGETAQTNQTEATQRSPAEEYVQCARACVCVSASLYVGDVVYLFLSLSGLTRVVGHGVIMFLF